MTPLILTLEGFIGVRDGLHRRSVTFDLRNLGQAELVAIVAPNGGAKSTLLDNLQPYPVMPSHAGGGMRQFSFYDHVYLEVNRKDLVWEHGGRLLRSELLIRLGARKSISAYLWEDHGGAWRPLRMADGTVSDGKMGTYMDCLESLCGSAATFFTCHFAAQARPALATYDNSSIKNLLVDMLDHADLRTTGQQCAEIARLLTAALPSQRRERSAASTEHERVGSELARVSDAAGRAAQLGLAAVELEGDALRAEREHARVLALHANARAARAAAELAMARQRAELERGAAEQIDALARRLAECEEAGGRIAAARAALVQRIAARQRRHAARAAELALRRRRCAGILAEAIQCRRGQRRTALAARVLAARLTRCDAAEAIWHAANADKAALALCESELAALEREVGAAALRRSELTIRVSLTGAVPCVGTDLQARCSLLFDAHAAQALVAANDVALASMARQRRALLKRGDSLRTALREMEGAEQHVRKERAAAARARSRAERCAALAARMPQMQAAREELAAVELAAVALAEHGGADTMNEAEQEEARVLQEQATQQAAAARQARAEKLARGARLQDDLAALPPLPVPLETAELAGAAVRAGEAQAALADNRRAREQALVDAGQAEQLKRRAGELEARCRQLDTHLAEVERELAKWSMAARCFGPNGALALLIDDAGPALTGIANKLLLACHGPRFTLSVHTQLTTAKGEAREGFRLVVHDADSGASKDVTFMSGGERVWINEALTRALALYLAEQVHGQGLAPQRTLYSDETDGAFDIEHKRAFMAMKREVLRLGGYAREYFISHTPALVQMADAVIDLGALRDGSADADNPVAAAA